MVRLGRYPLRTTACRPSAVLMSAYWLKRPSSSVSTARAIRSRAPCRISSCSGSLLLISGCERACRLDLDMAYHSSVGCNRRGDQPTGYATPSACFHTPEITITLEPIPTQRVGGKPGEPGWRPALQPHINCCQSPVSAPERRHVPPRRYQLTDHHSQDQARSFHQLPLIPMESRYCPVHHLHFREPY